MKNVLVTGSSGFVGRNLCSVLLEDKELNVLRFDRENSQKDLEKYLEKADFIFHLAGINRPKEESEFLEGNTFFTEQLLESLQKQNRQIPILFTSSIQAESDNPYGKSKKQAEMAIFDWAKKNKCPVYIYRLPNLFGKWSRPNYNSVIATFCYNVSRGIDIQINDPRTVLSLAYIDDVVTEFMSAMEGRANRVGKYCYVKRVYKVELGKLAEKIIKFNESRKNLIMPSLRSQLERNLYATFISYLSQDDFAYDLDMKKDERGWLSEFIKSKEFGQLFISKTRPGITRGNHWHKTKIEKFLVIEGEAEIAFRDIHSKKILIYKVSGNNLQVIDIPAGYTHSIKNIGKSELITVFWADEIFNQKQPDTYYQAVNQEEN